MRIATLGVGLRVFLSVLCGATLLLVLFVGIVFYESYDINLEAVQAVAAWTPQNNTRIFDRYGELIDEVYRHDRSSLQLKQMPAGLLKAVLSVEDARFWKHWGFDPKAIARALWLIVQRRSIRYAEGASTITQQVVRHFLLPNERSLTRKVIEILLAIRLEQVMTKEQILELYLNEFFLGEGAWGVAAASRRYFGKDLAACGIHELALIAGLFKAPSRFNPFRDRRRARQRQLHVLRRMVRSGYLSVAQARVVAQRPLVYRRALVSELGHAPYFVDHIVAATRRILGVPTLKNKGLRIYTTLDLDLQARARAALQSTAQNFAYIERESARRNQISVDKLALNAAILVADPRSGEILAMQGGLNYAKSQFNRTTQARRQSGSLFKAFVYSLAIERGFKWSDTIQTAPLVFEDGYRPRGRRDEYFKDTTLLRGLYKSLNVATMQLADNLGLMSILRHARHLGAKSPLKEEFGSVLGSSEMTLKELVEMYAVFANGGLQTPLYGVRLILDKNGQELYRFAPAESTRVLSTEDSFLVTQGLSQVLRRGTASKAKSLAHKAAGKTGTSNSARDNWFIGYTPNFIAGVWFGSDAFYPLASGASGASLALPAWLRFMEGVATHYPDDRFPVPLGLHSVRVHPRSGLKDAGGVLMWFKQGQNPRSVSSSLSQGPS